MSEESLSKEEKLNLEVLEIWMKCWNIPGLGMEKMVDEIYAEKYEVYTPLQNMYFVKIGKSKRRWKMVELSLEKLFKTCRMEIVWKMVKNNNIALEAKTHFTMVKGEEKRGGFAAFLTFEDGKIIRDHTYMRDARPLDSKSKNQKNICRGNSQFIYY